jgi:hypothetical protein
MPPIVIADRTLSENTRTAEPLLALGRDLMDELDGVARREIQLGDGSSLVEDVYSNAVKHA